MRLTSAIVVSFPCASAAARAEAAAAAPQVRTASATAAPTLNGSYVLSLSGSDASGPL